MGSCYRFAVVTMGLVAGCAIVGAGARRSPRPSTVTPIPPPAPAPPTEMPEVVVRGRAEDLLGNAQQRLAGRRRRRSTWRICRCSAAASCSKTVPGMVVTQHSGDGKANQYFLRGFNLDHGTDFAFSIDGVPVNLPSHAHGQGYSDLNFLIPELVDEIDFEKGPFYAGGRRLLGRRRGQHSSGEHAPRGDRQPADRSVRLRARAPGRQPDGRSGHAALRLRVQPLRRALGSARELQPLQRAPALPLGPRARRLQPDRERLLGARSGRRPTRSPSGPSTRGSSAASAPSIRPTAGRPVARRSPSTGPGAATARPPGCCSTASIIG